MQTLDRGHERGVAGDETLHGGRVAMNGRI
jgi:hypothetical protein